MASEAWREADEHDDKASAALVPAGELSAELTSDDGPAGGDTELTEDSGVEAAGLETEVTGAVVALLVAGVLCATLVLPEFPEPSVHPASDRPNAPAKTKATSGVEIRVVAFML